MAALATISIREPRKIFSACSPGRMGIVSGLGFAGVLVLAALPAPTMPVFGVDAPLWLLGAAGFAAVLRVALDATSSALVSMGRLRDAALMAFMVLIFFMMGVLVLTRLALPGPAAPVLALLVGVGAAVAWSVVRFQRLGVADRAGRGR
jgi:O-antigen/teichoic acid export membrane protein